MPTYEYACSSCGHRFEKFQSIKSPVIRKCPKCGKLKVKRLIGSGGGVIFKGSGFYQTDYKGCKNRKNKDTTDGGKEEKGKQGDGPSPEAGRKSSEDSVKNRDSAGK